ncbi:hypothetical protein EST38_g424 [Candolleomyces aberdarensis]|uniref:GP-PDE domain-containing protein n=1 Tax=Candolleomyces aberdarensis TaxID=2316362 RepID=A0A4Q2DYJ3_9AGAR|nr:hypothetical protein EST38_g424 [Candolleomyces aberdarensis]
MVVAAVQSDKLEQQQVARSLPECWGHRGASSRFPENTLASFEAAIRDGAEGIESDVHVSKDDVVVMFHDPVLTRTTDSTGHIKERNWYGEDGIEHVRTIKEPKQAIPTFAETIELLMKPENQHVKFNVDVKVQNDPDRLFRLMHKTVSSHQDWETLLAPRILLGLWHPCFLPHAKNHLGFRKQCKTAGKKIMVWTVNEPAHMMEDTNAAGVGGILTGSPTSIQHHSPVRRRTNSNDSRDRHSDSDPLGGRANTNTFIAATLAARHSPTLVRSFDPNDPDVRERQRTMDVDMAMQLSRARRETVTSTTSPFDTHPPSIHQGLGHGHHHLHHHSRHRQQQPEEHSPERSVFPVILDEEEDLGLGYDHPHQDVDLGGVGGVGVGGVGDGSEVLLNDAGSVDGDTLIPRRTRSDPSLRTTTTTTTPGVPGGVRLEIPDNLPSSSNYGLPTYQPNVSRTSFDFSRMEEFAAVEKAHLGIGSPVSATTATRFAIPEPVHVHHGRPSLTASGSGHDADLGGGVRGQQQNGGILGAGHASTSSIPRISGDMQSSQLPQGSSSGTEDIEHGQQLPQKPLRHRKISQSNSARPRPARKGIGGKISLFESAPTEPVPRLPPLLSSNLAASSGLNPYSDFVISGSAAQILGGNLHPAGQGHDRPYRFSFYSNALSATIHARSLSELPAEGQSFEDLFAGNQPQAPPPPFQASSFPMPHTNLSNGSSGNGINGNDLGYLGSIPKDRPTSSLAFTPPPPGFVAGHRTSPSDGASVYASSARRVVVPEKVAGPVQGESDNTWWLDVMCPTDEEMKMLSKVFNIHPLTTEDILMEETREKIELFRNYYLVCFRGFDQDQYSPTHLEPLNMYIIVFREGTLSFHFRPTPHPQNVRRRIKQLKDYISVTSDWISYALIDDITDAFGPLIQSIEYEVDSIDELVLILKEAEQSDMLRRIGTCRKKVMGLLRLMGNKADVVKGLAKRCNENWSVAPRSDIGLYLSDIQDHLITMTQNLNHYEKILSRSHSNYLAQISIEMTDANNQINDVLSKLTALGTVLIPMNLVTGLWGMNVHVPGEDVEQGYVWFASIIACLAAFALIGGYSTYKFMVPK